MKAFAARYENTGPTDYEIVIYENEKMAEENPHDYLLSFTKSQWRKMGCRAPKKNENMAVELTAKVAKLCS